MLKICRDKWDKNKEKLRNVLANRTDLNSCDYSDLVKLSFDTIFNDDRPVDELDIEKITEIDNGDYQGTLLYIVPFKTYQPCEFEYLMTSVSYGSCSGCDTLQAIQEWDLDKNTTEQQLTGYMQLCKDIVTSVVRPFSCGWRKNDNYTEVSE